MAIPIIPTPRYVPAPDHYFLLNSKSTDIDLVMALQHWQFPSAAYPKHGFILQDIPKHGQLRFNYSLKKKNHQGVIEVLLLRQAFVVHNDDFKDESVLGFWDSKQYSLVYVENAVQGFHHCTHKGYNHATASLAWYDAKIKAGWEKDWFNAADESSNHEFQSCHYNHQDNASIASLHDLQSCPDDSPDAVADQVAVAHQADQGAVDLLAATLPVDFLHVVELGCSVVGPLAGHELVDQHPDGVVVPHAGGELVGYECEDYQCLPDHAANSSSREELVSIYDEDWLNEVPGHLSSEVLSSEWVCIGSSDI